MSDATILVVDDSPTVRRAIKLMLIGGGYDVVEAGDGLEALKLLESEQVDLVVTDLYMPALDGLGLVRRMRAESTTRFVPVLVLTTEGHYEVRDDLKQAGATAVVEKPIDQDGLREVVRRCLPQVG